MVTRKPIYLDSEGFPTEFSPSSDGIAVDNLTVNGTGGITLVSGTITGVPTPTADNQVANKSYVDSVAQGLDVHGSVKVTTSGVDLGITYNATGGIAGTGEITGAPLLVDGVTPLVSGTRILVKDQTDAKQNGIYVVTSPGVWERATDMDENDEISAGAFVFVEEGTINADNGYVVTSNDPHTLNTTVITWSQFSGAGQIYAAAGLIKVGNQIDIELHTAANAQGVGADGGSSGLEFDVTGVGGKLRAKVDPAGGIQRGASGILLELDDTPNTLDVDADGLKVVGLPINFLINDVTTSGTVTAANLNELTLGGVTILHSHAGVSAADRTQNTYTTDGVGVTIGDPVYFSGNGIVSRANASNATGNQVVGVALTTVGASSPVSIVSDGRVNGVVVGAVAGDQVYLAPGGGLTVVKPTGGGARITLAGFAINTTDLQVEINFLGRLN